jgi:hypothetical protein
MAKIKTSRPKLEIILRLEEIRQGTHIVVCVKLGAWESLTLVTTYGVSLLISVLCNVERGTVGLHCVPCIALISMRFV